MARKHDFERIYRASTFAPVVGAVCHTFDPRRVDDARRVYGTLRDFTSSKRVLDGD